MSSERHSGSQHLVKMANDIGRFFGAEPEREEAIAGIANHIAKFWTQRMRDKLAAHISRGAGHHQLRVVLVVNRSLHRPSPLWLRSPRG